MPLRVLLLAIVVVLATSKVRVEAEVADLIRLKKVVSLDPVIVWSPPSRVTVLLS